MKELTDTMTQNEKTMVKKIGKTYLKVLKIMGVFLLLGIILTGVAAAQAQPANYVVQLNAGESIYLSQFYGEAGDTAQFGFGITEENGVDYQYPEIGDAYELYKFMETMDWKVNMIVEYSESFSFTAVEKIKDISGEINFVNFELYKDGFYRMKITNLTDTQLTISVGKAEINFTVLTLAVVSWIMFGLMVGLFSLMVHFGFWLLVIYLIIKALSIIQEDKHRSHPTVIGPSGSIGPDTSQRNT